VAVIDGIGDIDLNSISYGIFHYRLMPVFSFGRYVNLEIS
jgi:hypothetical protein